MAASRGCREPGGIGRGAIWESPAESRGYALESGWSITLPQEVQLGNPQGTEAGLFSAQGERAEGRDLAGELDSHYHWQAC